MQTGEAATIGSTEMMQKIERALEGSLTDIFETMFNERVRVIPQSEIGDAPRISSVVGFTGRISGLLCLHLSSIMACNVASGLLGMPMTQVDETVRDAVGELSNMLAGGLKKQLSNTDNLFKISIPSVIQGLEYSMHAPPNSHQVWMGIAAGECRFKIQLILEAQ
jgi:chemotaxis protein CheX